MSKWKAQDVQTRHVLYPTRDDLPSRIVVYGVYPYIDHNTVTIEGSSPHGRDYYTFDWDERIEIKNQ